MMEKLDCVIHRLVYGISSFIRLSNSTKNGSSTCHRSFGMLLLTSVGNDGSVVQTQAAFFLESLVAFFSVDKDIPSHGYVGPHFNGNVCTFPVTGGWAPLWYTCQSFPGKRIMLHPLSPPVASFFCPKTHSSTSRVESWFLLANSLVFGKTYDFYVLDFGGLKPSKVANHWLIHQPKQFQQTRTTVSANRMKSSSVPTKPNSTKPLPPQLPKNQAQQIVLVESIAFAVVAVLVSTVATRFHWVVQRDSLRGIKQVFRTQIRFQQMVPAFFVSKKLIEFHIKQAESFLIA